MPKNMEEPVFIKCEPEWPLDTEEEPSNIEQNAVTQSDNQSKIKEDPYASDVDLTSLHVVDIKMVKESCCDEEKVKETHDKEGDNSGGSAHESTFQHYRISTSSSLGKFLTSIG
ncbi:uncharacterized protein [Anabrus simplex]|uniref:uncharacterized protein isoform X2 n=1 Tax=Anabrus simplex TaxID=316456 RepID=UPI0035A3018F